ncbi:tyrosine-type recombinase/integrase [Cupriavidus sp. CP313]
MAKAYPEGKGWAFRLRIRGQDIYRSGFATEAEAKQAIAKIKAEHTDTARASGSGPYQTSLAIAFSNYALQRFPFLKGAAQDKNRINRYLRALGLPVIELTKTADSADGARRYWEVALVREEARAIPNSLRAHRAAQAGQTIRSDEIRAQLAATKMADVTTHQVQTLIDAMVSEGYGPATIDHERAEVRRLFSHARRVWNWRAPHSNPASDVKAPAVDNARDRVLTNDEWKAIGKALARYKNPYALPIVCLMLETAMRSCEPLSYATWGDVDWTRRVLCLQDSKGGKRNVPLNPEAIALLKGLRAQAGAASAGCRIFPTTYEAIGKAWRVACEQAGVTGVTLHDLRHTAATRYAREFNGNLPVIMQITGHKTVKMAMRYINIKAEDVSQMMHGDVDEVGRLPAGYKAKLTGPDESTEAAEPPAEPAKHGNVVRVNFARKAA